MVLVSFSGREMDIARVAVIIEDDEDIREIISVILTQSGFEVHAVNNGAAGVEAVREHNPAVVTLDLGLPDIDGFEVVRRVRAFSDAYIIMLTGRADEMDTLLGLESGADDYITKPFRPRELRARIAAMMRRPRFAGDPAPASVGTPLPASAPQAEVALPTAAAPAGAVAESSDVWSLNGLVLNSGVRTVQVDGKELELTRTEFDLIKALADSGKNVRTKADLVRRLRGEDYDVGSFISDSDERTIEVHMANLRRKMGDNPRDPRWIKTVRGVGYRLVH